MIDNTPAPESPLPDRAGRRAQLRRRPDDARLPRLVAGDRLAGGPARRRARRQRIARRRGRARVVRRRATARSGCSSPSPTSASPAAATSGWLRPASTTTSRCSTTTRRSTRAGCGRWWRSPRTPPELGAVSAKMLFAERFHGVDLDGHAGAPDSPRPTPAHSASGSAGCASTATGSTTGSVSTSGSTVPRHRRPRPMRRSPAGRPPPGRCASSPTEGHRRRSRVRLSCPAPRRVSVRSDGRLAHRRPSVRTRRGWRCRSRPSRST